MRLRPPQLPCLLLVASGLIAFAAIIPAWQRVQADDAAKPGVKSDTPAAQKSADQPSPLDQQFQQTVQPMFQKYCWRCHNVDDMKSGVRVDQLTAIPEDRHLLLLKGIQQQIDDGVMPPPEEAQPTAEESQRMVAWIQQAMIAAQARDRKKNGSVRRLTVAQYRNTLKSLLGLQEDLTDSLPPDGISKDGFANNGHVMVLSPLQVEAYFEITEKALDLCLVDEYSKPVIETFRMEFGRSINKQPCPDQLILGANNALLNNADFIVTEPRPQKSFDFQPFAMRTKYDFIEGYVGNDTIRKWRSFDSIYHSVFACVRGTPGYPKGEPNEVIPEGLALRPAIPSSEIFGVSNTYGPMANFKISLRELPEQGNFRVTVKAARYNDGLLLNSGEAVQGPPVDASDRVIVDVGASTILPVQISSAGVYQVDVACLPGKPQGAFKLELGGRHFTGQLFEPANAAAVPKENGEIADQSTPFLLVRLPAGELKWDAKYGNNSRLKRLILTRLSDDSSLARRFATYEKRSPSLGVHAGLRRDCGSTLTQVGGPQAVTAGEFLDFVFEGAIRDYPNPDVEKDNVNYLAGIREIGVRSEWTDGRDMPRLLIKSIQFEGPYYETWPPVTHRNIFPESARRDDPAAHAREVISRFATRAFRRPVTQQEEETLVRVWQDRFAETKDFQKGIRDALLVVLTSPQFLFLIENSATPEPEDLDGFELASKLSYFLWNTPPDDRLLELAATQKLAVNLDSEVARLVQDQRFNQFVREFASQWLSLDKLDVVATDEKRYPQLTRDTKTQLHEEPIEFVKYLIQNNLPVRNLVQSDVILANEVVATYYNLGDRTESGFQFIPIKHETSHLGGLLTQAGILAGLSDGRESNPIKRGAWMARKIVAEPPADPPPNVPQLKEDDGTKLTLRQKLERHRNQKGCVKCHSGIDPWGIPFEAFDAAGMLKKDAVDCQSKLPDGKDVADVNGLKKYLAEDRIDQIAFSFMKHIAVYAVGRSLSYNETVELREQARKVKGSEYRMQDLVKEIVKSDLFLKK